MASVVLNGPVVPVGVHNTVLNGVVIHSPVGRSRSPTDFYTVDVGVREGEFTDWIGTYNQSEQLLAGATPTPMLAEGRSGMRLRSGQALVVRISLTGTPDTIRGSRVTFSLGLVGGRDGVAKPLVSSGVSVAEPNTRVSLAALERQINQGLAHWDEGVDLADPFDLAPDGAFGGRLQVDSTTQISLQQYAGGYVEVDGTPVPIGSGGIACAVTDGLVSSLGVATSTAPSSSTLYYAYVSSGGELRLSSTAPSLHRGSYYLGTDAGAALWRFCGWVYVDGSTQFADDETNRHVANYYNRVRKSVVLTPGYNDNSAATSFATTSTSWALANGGTGATGSYVANGEDAVRLRLRTPAVNSGANDTYAGIGESSSTDAVAAGVFNGGALGMIAADYDFIPSASYRTVSMLIAVAGGTGTFYADLPRLGGSADPRGATLTAEVMV